MLPSAFRRFLPQKRQPELPRIPDGMVVFAVGDIHGRADLLSQTLRSIRADAQGSAGRTTIIFLGDYIDRGPASREVIDMLLAYAKDRRFTWRFLRGNHDQSIRDFLHEPTAGEAWMLNGGGETLRSYGVEPPQPGAPREAWVAAAEALVAAIPPQHLKFFRSLEPWCEIGDYVFVHAGLRPGVPLEEQKEKDLMWIREPFLSDPHPLPKVVVHGHTPYRDVYADRRRIGIDTGAFFTGVLTALRLEGASGSVIQTCGEARPDFAEPKMTRRQIKPDVSVERRSFRPADGEHVQAP
jgi:serine/threonine protein phosphatase 1